MLTRLLIAAGIAGAATTVPALPAQAEQIRTITCQSWDERTQYCPLPKKTRQVVLTRNLSDKNCDRGRNWEVRKNRGYDELWVRRGCRGEFTVRYGY